MSFVNSLQYIITDGVKHKVLHIWLCIDSESHTIAFDYKGYIWFFFYVHWDDITLKLNLISKLTS